VTSITVHLGTSGWQYRHWRGGFYPETVRTADWLGHYARRFATVEVNAAFYRLPEVSTFRRWAEGTPDDFVVTVKASRYLTHIRRLAEPEEPVHRLLERCQGLGGKLGPVLLQLPPDLRADATALDRVLAAFPTGVRVAVEPRHDSWWVPEVRSVLEARQAALCLADRRGVLGPVWRTADWGYVRFHWGRARPDSGYGTAALEGWAERLAGLWPARADVYAYFNNDPNGCAPRDAHRFAVACRRAGLRPTRTPPPRETPTSPS
jgi:uncharacterized protein YecE (DUF72 family)